jgi:hypothetical protein
MRIDVHIPGAELFESLKAHAVGRIVAAVASLSARRPQASVRLSEFVGDGRGAVLTACRIEVSAETLPDVVVGEAVAANPYRAIDEATERLVVALQAVRPPDSLIGQASDVRLGFGAQPSLSSPFVLA